MRNSDAAEATAEAEADDNLAPALPLPSWPTQPVRDLGTMIGLLPRVPYGCLGWHLAIQPGPARHAPVDRLPPLLWFTSALCPVLILPAFSAEAVARGSAIRVPSAIRMPRLPAWEHAVALIVRRNQQARRHRRDYPHPAGALSRAASLSAALRLVQTLEDVARSVSGKDPMRRGCSAASAPGSEVSDRLSAARPASTRAVTAAPARVEHPLRRENGAPASLFAASAGMSGDGALPHPVTARVIAAHARDPMRRENSSPRSGPLRNGNPRGNPNLAPRCGARTRQGCPCKGPAMRNGRCRMHGGKSTGPRTAEGLARLRAAARARHGGEAAAEARTFARSCRALIRDTRVLLALAERPAENRPAFDPEALFDVLLTMPQAVTLSGPPQPPSGQTDGRSPCAVRAALPEPPIGPSDQARAGLGFGPFGALHLPRPLRQDPVRRERQPLRQPLAARVVLPAPAPTAGPQAGATAAREHSLRP